MQNYLLPNYNYKKAEKECKKAVRQAKRKFEVKISKSGQQKPFVSYVRSKVKNRTPVGPIKHNGSTIFEDKEMAEVLNTYFCSIFNKEDTRSLPASSQQRLTSHLNNIYINKKEVIDKLCNLDVCKAPGPDKVYPRVLKEFAVELSEGLCIVFNKSLVEGYVPGDWKQANVTPIFKKGSKASVSNYRPVSLTSVPCRVMESILKDKITRHLEENKSIKDSQHGFLRNRSCVTNLLHFMEVVTQAVDEGVAVDIIYLDFSKAFDKVPFKRLLKKLESYGIEGTVLRWIESWLIGRQQRVVLNGNCSEWSPVKSGVPQGSILGPLAFILYIEDLENGVENLLTLINKFADDTKLCKRIKCQFDQAQLQECLNHVMNWAVNWGMTFNIDKCKVLHLGRNNPENKYDMGGVQLETVSWERDLGIIVNKDLKPSLQCREAARKANLVLTQILKAFHFRDRHTYLRLYKQYVRCHLEYCTQVWSPWLQSDIDILEKVQIRAIKQITGLKGQSYEEKLRELNLLSLLDRRKRFDLIETFKILQGKSAVEKDVFFKTMQPGDRVTRTTSFPLNLKYNRCNLDVRRNFFSNRVINDWNLLPNSIKSSVSVIQFKNRLDKYYLQRNN